MMPIKPSEIESKKRKDVLEIINDICHDIDEALVRGDRKFKMNYQPSIAISKWWWASNETRSEVLDLYMENGWKISILEVKGKWIPSFFKSTDTYLIFEEKGANDNTTKSK